MAVKTKPEGRTIYVPKDSFVCDVEGVPCVFVAGVTRVREGHPVLEGREQLFEPMRVHYEWETATAAPGEVRS